MESSAPFSIDTLEVVLMVSGNKLRTWPCPHCDYVAESIEDRNDHITGHRVVKDRSGDGPPERHIV